MQTDGRLVIEADGLATPSLSGGIDVDGSYRVGGYATQLGGTVHTLSETVGQMADGTFEGTVLASTTGTYNDERFDCNAEYTTHGARDAE